MKQYVAQVGEPEYPAGAPDPPGRTTFCLLHGKIFLSMQVVGRFFMKNALPLAAGERPEKSCPDPAI